mgnify:CR=1 FL=1
MHIIMTKLLEICIEQFDTFKILFESLSKFFNDVNLSFGRCNGQEDDINKGFIIINGFDDSRSISFNLKLYDKYFTKFHCTTNDKTSVGINLRKFNAIFRTVNEIDFVTLYIDDKHTNKIKIIIKKDNVHNIYTLKIGNAEIENDNYNYNFSIGFETYVIPCKIFHTTCKEISNHCDFVEFQCLNNQFTIKPDGKRLSESIQCVFLGVEIKQNTSKLIKSTYDVKYINAFHKLTKISQTVKLFVRNDYSSIIEYNLSSFGSLSLFVTPVHINNDIENNDIENNDIENNDIENNDIENNDIVVSY